MIKLLVKKRDGSKSILTAHDYSKLCDVMNSRMRCGEIVDYEVM